MDAQHRTEVFNKQLFEIISIFFYLWFIITFDYNTSENKRIETHILHNFDRDLYGCVLKVCIVGYIRPERNFDSLEALIATINNDIQEAEILLKKPEHQHYKTSSFFKANSSNGISNGHT